MITSTVSTTSSGIRRQPFTLPKKVIDQKPETICFRVPNGMTTDQFRRLMKWSEDEKEAPEQQPFKATQIVGNTLFLGDVNDARNAAGIKAEGITHIVSCCPELDTTIPSVEGVDYLKVRLQDCRTAQISAHFEDVYRFIEEALNSNENAKILIHCAAGISRSSSFVILFLMRYFHIDFDTALKAVCELRNVVWPNFGFQRQLREYETFLFSTIK